VALGAMLLAGLALSSGGARAAGRDAALIGAFRTLCTLATPNFAGIAQKASAMRLPIHRNLAKDYGDGRYARSKSWFVPLATGRIELLDAESNGPAAHAISCGINAPDADGRTLRQDLAAALRLGRPNAETLAPGGALQMTMWENPFGTGSSLIFVDPSRPGLPGAMVSYTIKTPPQR
jgi:hypothetical protein